jgi:hypothetical protein
VTNIVTLQQAKSWLRYPNPSQAHADDAAIQIVINAADEVIQYECDDILPHRYNENYDGGSLYVHLRHLPVLSVENVQEGWGWITYDLDYVEVNSSPPSFSMFAYSIDNPESGIISRRSAGNVQIPFRPGSSNIQVQYTTGTQTIPGTIIHAELELIAHWWQNSQLRAVAVAGANIGYDAVSGSAYTRDTEMGNQNLNIGVPYRILEQLKPRRHMPFFA